MGINRISIFLHILAFSSGVSVGNLSEPSESDVLFPFGRYSRYVVDGVPSATIGKYEVGGDEGRSKRSRAKGSPQR